MKNRKPTHDNWKTPDWLLEEIRAEFGEFFDPCPLNADFDGLEVEWGAVNYINPPYNRMLKEAFIRKALEESQKGKVCVMLLPVSTSTQIFHRVIAPNAEVRFLEKRVKFEGINSKGEKVSNKTGQHDSMKVIFSNCSDGFEPNIKTEKRCKWTKDYTDKFIKKLESMPVQKGKGWA